MTTRVDIESLPNLEKFEVNPLYYAHVVMLQIISKPHLAFMNGNVEAGLQSLIIGVEHLERICRADGIIKADTYKEELAKAMSEVGIDTSDGKKLNTSELAKLANIKLELVCTSLFKKKGARISATVR